jgi:hypothetical protein
MRNLTKKQTNKNDIQNLPPQSRRLSRQRKSPAHVFKRNARTQRKNRKVQNKKVINIITNFKPVCYANFEHKISVSFPTDNRLFRII